MTDPTYVNLADLPADTIIEQAEDITLALTAAPDGSGALVPQLIITSTDLGMYRYLFGRDVLRSLVNQVLWFSKLKADDFRTINEGLQHD